MCSSFLEGKILWTLYVCRYTLHSGNIDIRMGSVPMVIRSKFLYLSHSFAFKSIGIWGFKIHLKEIQQEYV